MLAEDWIAVVCGSRFIFYRCISCPIRFVETQKLEIHSLFLLSNDHQFGWKHRGLCIGLYTYIVDKSVTVAGKVWRQLFDFQILRGAKFRELSARLLALVQQSIEMTALRSRNVCGVESDRCCWFPVVHHEFAEKILVFVVAAKKQKRAQSGA